MAAIEALAKPGPPEASSPHPRNLAEIKGPFPHSPSHLSQWIPNSKEPFCLPKGKTSLKASGVPLAGAITPTLISLSLHKNSKCSSLAPPLRSGQVTAREQDKGL